MLNFQHSAKVNFILPTSQATEMFYHKWRESTINTKDFCIGEFPYIYTDSLLKYIVILTMVKAVSRIRSLYSTILAINRFRQHQRGVRHTRSFQARVKRTGSTLFSTRAQCSDVWRKWLSRVSTA